MEIIHDFIDDSSLLTFLAGNTVNIFLYGKMEGQGCASVIDYASSVGRPIRISDIAMFRHIYSEEICVYKTQIQDIIERENQYW